MSSTITITINGQSTQATPDETILSVAERLGIHIPVLCHLKGRAPLEQCGVCAVEIEGREALAYACAARVADGMRVLTDSPTAREARRTALELMLSEHVGDCVGPCELACPARIRIPVFLRQIMADDQTGAMLTLLESVALPSVLGRICARFCENACRRKAIDAPVAICALKCIPGDAFLESDAKALVPCAASTGKRVAVVGAGVAGLTAAFYLLRHGYAVNLYDQAAALGGALREIDGALLPPAIRDAEIQRIEALGAWPHLGKVLGQDVTLADLSSQHSAVVLAVGAPVVEGADVPSGRPPKRQVDVAWLAAQGFEATDKGVVVDRATFATSTKGVYAIGAVVRPAATAVQSSAMGRQVADVIHAALGGQLRHETQPVNVRMKNLSPGDLAVFAAHASRAGRKEPSLPNQPADAPKTPSPSASEEAKRCLHCDCVARDACTLRDLATACEADPGAYAAARAPLVQDATHAAVVYEPGKCVKCGRCIAIAEEHQDRLGLSYVGRGFQVQVGVPFGESLAAGLAQAAQACAEACPTGALSRRHGSD